MDDRWKQLVVFIIIGILAGVGTFRLAETGRLPIKGLTNSQTFTQGLQTRTVVQEENAVVDAVQNSSPSVVAIGVNQRISPFNDFNPFDPFSNPQNPAPGSRTQKHLPADHLSLLLRTLGDKTTIKG